MRIWGDSERQRLKRVRKLLGMNQAAFAQHLHANFDVALVDQSTVSGWELRSRPDDDHLDAIHSMWEQLDRGETRIPEGDDESATSGARELDEQDVFDKVTRELTEEPSFGDRQDRLINAVIRRIENGPALSPEDERALAATADTLRIPAYSAHLPVLERSRGEDA